MDSLKITFFSFVLSALLSSCSGGGKYTGEWSNGADTLVIAEAGDYFSLQFGKQTPTICKFREGCFFMLEYERPFLWEGDRGQLTNLKHLEYWRLH